MAHKKNSCFSHAEARSRVLSLTRMCTINRLAQFMQMSWQYLNLSWDLHIRVYSFGEIHTQIYWNHLLGLPVSWIPCCVASFNLSGRSINNFNEALSFLGIRDWTIDDLGIWCLTNSSNFPSPSLLKIFCHPCSARRYSLNFRWIVLAILWIINVLPF